MRTVTFGNYQTAPAHDQVQVVASNAPHGAPWIKGNEGMLAEEGTYIHRDDIVKFLRELKDQSPQGADARSWLESAALELSTRGG
jgi:hypothetical protein